MSINSVSSITGISSSNSMLEVRLENLQNELDELEKSGSKDEATQKRKDSLSAQIALLKSQINESSGSTATQSASAKKSPPPDNGLQAEQGQAVVQAFQLETGSAGSKLDVKA